MSDDAAIFIWFLMGVIIALPILLACVYGG